MSKCREEFEKLYKGQTLVKSVLFPEKYADYEVQRAWNYWQAAWNARGKVDAEICKKVANYPLMSDGAKGTADYLRVTIEQENEK